MSLRTLDPYVQAFTIFRLKTETKPGKQTNYKTEENKKNKLNNKNKNRGCNSTDKLHWDMETVVKPVPNENASSQQLKLSPLFAFLSALILLIPELIFVNSRTLFSSSGRVRLIFNKRSNLWDSQSQFTCYQEWPHCYHSHTTHFHSQV